MCRDDVQAILVTVLLGLEGVAWVSRKVGVLCVYYREPMRNFTGIEVGLPAEVERR